MYDNSESIAGSVLFIPYTNKNIFKVAYIFKLPFLIYDDLEHPWRHVPTKCISAQEHWYHKP